MRTFRQNVNAYEEWRAREDERRQLLQGTTDAEKDARLRALGFEPTDHPYGEPCSVCGYPRRYRVWPNNCLFCQQGNA